MLLQVKFIAVCKKHLSLKKLLPESLLFLILLLNSCSPKQQNPDQINYFKTDSTIVQTGGVTMIPVTTPKGRYNVWTKRTGSNPKIKVLLLAGGPGFPHDYLEAFESFFPAQNIEFYYYDELGSGNSDKPDGNSIYSIDTAVEEIEQVRKALHLDKDNFYIYGHSWGGLLAMEYALKYQNNLKAMIVSNMCSSGKEFNRYVQQELTKQIPVEIMSRINKLAENTDYDNPEYINLVTKHFYSKFICRIPIEKWPEPLNRGFGKLNKSYYMKFQGPNEFGIVGDLKNWDISGRLKNITIPTLMIGAKYDEIDPLHIKWMSKQVKNGHYLYCSKGSHLSMYDQQNYYMKGIIDFIKKINHH
ncbi:proline iminopeptidase [Chryseobacterium sp. Leaf405]|uniref:proline iminopeptidase-family hydrolase n=1 Tax=Chryseobacterium sp. Leaf405 TaxID=1736367 RepID=UPI0006FDBE71|nr:proline iminopeptidase-family hydrolase [Chryseobacterium sp. Leaf405]KQT35804.1 proline iminopeptidase [Chryseobacterium sp. Leaf405]